MEYIGKCKVYHKNYLNNYMLYKNELNEYFIRTIKGLKKISCNNIIALQLKN